MNQPGFINPGLALATMVYHGNGNIITRYRTIGNIISGVGATDMM